jgi:hypothetical protein
MRGLRGRRGETPLATRLRARINSLKFYTKMDLAGGFVENAARREELTDELKREYEEMTHMKFKP